MWLRWTKTPNRRKVMLKNKLMSQFKEKFGGSFSKENGSIYWSKDDHKELVTSGFLLHYLRSENKVPGKKKVESVKPVQPKKPDVVPVPVKEEIKQEVKEEEKPKVFKKAPVKKHESKTEPNSELPEGS